MLYRVSTEETTKREKGVLWGYNYRILKSVTKKRLKIDVIVEFTRVNRGTEIYDNIYN